MKITMNAISERQRASLYIYKKAKKMRNVLYIYKNPDTFQKARKFPFGFIYKKPDTLRYTVFHEILELGIYIQKA